MSIGALLIGFSPILAKAVALSPTGIAFFRFLLGSICMAIYIAITRPKLDVEKYKTILPYLFGAGLMFATDLWLWHRSIFSVGAGIATLLANTQVFYLVVISLVIFKEYPKWHFYPGMILAFVGLAMVTTPVINFGVIDEATGGIIYGLLTGLSYAFVTTFMKKSVARYGGSTPWIIFGITIFATICTLIMGLIESSLALPKTNEFFILLLYGGGVHFLGWLLITKSMTSLPVVIVSLLLLLQPIFASLFGVIIYDEHLSMVQIFGFVICLPGIFFASTAKR